MIENEMVTMDKREPAIVESIVLVISRGVKIILGNTPNR
jgi:hypothetical protein